MPPKLGIVAGGGTLPARLIEVCRAQGREVFVLALRGHADPAAIPPEVPRAWIALGESGAGIERMREQGVREVVLAGSVTRPALSELVPDARTLRFLARVAFRALGDDGLLRAILGELESEGFAVIGVETILTDLLAPAGQWGRVRPDAQAEADIAAGIAEARAHGAADLGQAVAIQNGRVLDREGADGTDALIRRAGARRIEGPGPVLVKTSKPGQERRIDLPTVGPATVTEAAAAGFAGIAVEAGGTLVIDRAATVAAADAAGLFLVGIELR